MGGLTAKQETAGSTCQSEYDQKDNSKQTRQHQVIPSHVLWYQRNVRSNWGWPPNWRHTSSRREIRAFLFQIYRSAAIATEVKRLLPRTILPWLSKVLISNPTPRSQFWEQKGRKQKGQSMQYKATSNHWWSDTHTRSRAYYTWCCNMAWIVMHCRSCKWKTFCKILQHIHHTVCGQESSTIAKKM